MTDWSKHKVADLKEELKNRGVPLTGLKLKQQLIDKLVEVEAVDSNDDDEQLEVLSKGEEGEGEQDDHAPETEAEKVETKGNGEGTDCEVDGTVKENAGEPGQGKVENAGLHEADKVPTSLRDNEPPVDPNATTDEAAAAAPDEQSLEPAKETVTGNTPETHGLAEADAADDGQKPFSADATTLHINPETETTRVADVVDSLTMNQEAPTPQRAIDRTQESVADGDAETNGQPSSTPHTATTEPASTPQHLVIPASSGTSTPSSLTAELMEDSRKRKRRSVTPPTSASDIAAKRAKASNGSSIIINRETSALEQVQNATDAAEAIQNANGLEGGGSVNMQSVMPEPQEDSIMANAHPKPEPTMHSEAELIPEKKQAESETPAIANPEEAEPQVEADRYVSPARHPATSSLYIRNFKRPLQLPVLRSHIVSLAGASSDDEPVKTIYLDSIRTHALVTLTSIAMASRVRSAMHEARFPDEPNRVPLFVDFVPDESVQGWIDEESNGRGGKFEVIYRDKPDGVEAVLRNVGAIGSTVGKDSGFNSGRTAQPPAPTRPASSIGGGAVASLGPGVHPDRARLVPHEPSNFSSASASTSHRNAAKPEKQAETGTGFKALDELFSHTTAKPKLYYKPVSSRIADVRLDLIKDLRIGHSEMGKSGDEGMKRYTFETFGESQRQEWIDKGPEFGYGPRGQSRLEGRGSGGGGRGGRGGWRGDGGHRGGRIGRFDDRDRDGRGSWRGR